MIPNLGQLGRVRGLEGIVRRINEADDRISSNQVVPLALGALFAALFDTPGGTAKIATPEQYHAPADNISDDTAAAQAAHDALHARGGGVLLLTGPYYRLGGLMLRSGVILATLAAQKGTGRGFACSIRPPTGFTGGWMVDGALEQTLTFTGSPTAGSFPLTGGWGGSATTAAIAWPPTAASIQAAVTTLPGLGSTMVTGTVAAGFTITFGSDVGYPAVGGTMIPATLVPDNTGLTGGAAVCARVSVDGAGVHGLSFFGGVTSGADPAIGGVRMRHSNKFHASGISGNAVNRPMLLVGGGEATIEHVNAQILAFTAPAAPMGAVTTYGADHRIDDVELAGCVLPGGALVDSTNFYHCALAVNSITTTVTRALTEFGDADIYVGGSDGVYIGCRADMSGAHGILEANYVYGNTFTDTTLLSPGLSADNTYDGMNLNGVGHKVDGVMVDYAPQSVLTANRARFVVYDGDTGGSNWQVARDYESTFGSVRGNVATWGSDLFFSVAARPCRQSSGGDPAARPPARLALGRSWWDTLAGRATHSDGTFWRDPFEDVVSNVLPPAAVTFIASIGWQPTAGLAVNPVIRADGHADFATPWEGQATANAAAVTAGAVSVATTGLGTPPAVVAGTTYLPAVRAISPRAGGTVTFQVTWKNAGGTDISTSTSAAVALGTTNTLAVAAAVMTAPALAVSAVMVLNFACTGLAAGDVFRFATAHLAAGTASLSDVEPV